MNLEVPRTSVFTFQSSVHCLHVLRCLDEQRRKEILCDVTVVVESQSYRAHRSVLAACSDYFHSRVSKHAGLGLIITLPEEVTVEGFEPLLQFAYTAKLLFTKENIVEIHNCAEILGFHNLDKACFDFLIPKFFDHGKGTAGAQRKACGKTKCCQRKASQENSGTSSDGHKQEEERTGVEPSRAVLNNESDTAQSLSPAPVSELPVACGPGCSDEHEQTDSSLLCPKYRKFQMACGKDRCCLEDCGPQVPPVPPAATTESRASPCLPCTSDENNDVVSDSSVQIPQETVGLPQNVASSLAGCLTCAPGSSTCTGFLQTLDLSCGQPAGSSSVSPVSCPEGPLAATVALEGEGGFGCSAMEGTVDFDPTESALCSLVPESGGGRSRVEREVAEHLAKGFWPDPPPPQAEPLPLDPEAESALGKTADFHWLKHLDLTANPGDCPFLRDLGEEVQLPELEGAAQPEKSFCVSPENSGDNSDSDSEGDSESYTSERAREIQLPFPVEKISSLSRNDFQQLLRVQSLTREQLDFVHDVRRRSKNRIAAQRCRKRKLECIVGLEGEIHKLRGEKEKLVAEREQLKRRKIETLRSLSELCHRVCSEAALSSDQLDFLAQYSSPDCPVSVLMSSAPSPSLSLSFSLTLQDEGPAPAGVPVDSSPSEDRLPTPTSPVGGTQTSPLLPCPSAPALVPPPPLLGTVECAVPDRDDPAPITGICLDSSGRCPASEVSQSSPPLPFL
ncbi:hypothetical protein GJAV_G00050680 [Gymnothorax javanicus]|nr:hypothetical protein GJAV_G00050680 [Gymnothorax javanicus]